MTDQQPQDAPFPGADDANVEAEHVMPPEQAPMDDAAGGPQAEDGDVPFEDDETRDTSTGDLSVQGGE